MSVTCSETRNTESRYGKEYVWLKPSLGKEEHLFFLMPKSLTSNLCYLTIN